MSELSPELQRLADAVQEFAAATADRPVLVTQAIVVYEETGFDDDGAQCRRISYSVPTDNFSLSGALGLLDAGQHYVRRDILGPDEDE